MALAVPALLLAVCAAPLSCGGGYPEFDPDLPISLHCEEPDTETFLFEDIAVSVSHKHCVDKSGPDSDGYYWFYYDYRVFAFTSGSVTLYGRSYRDAPEEASILSIEDRDGGGRRLLKEQELRDFLPRAAIWYFRQAGATGVTWLDPANEIEGYTPVP